MLFSLSFSHPPHPSVEKAGDPGKKALSPRAPYPQQYSSSGRPHAPHRAHSVHHTHITHESSPLVSPSTHTQTERDPQHSRTTNTGRSHPHVLAFEGLENAVYQTGYPSSNHVTGG